MPSTSTSSPMFCLWILAIFVLSSSAQTANLFQWQLTTNSNLSPAFNSSDPSPALPTCTPLKISVTSLSANVTPPYYMIAFAVGGTPVTSLIGSDERNLSWTVTQPVGSRLILTVIDANGSAGGTQLQILTVIAGQTTQCVTNLLTAPPFTVKATVKKNGLATCKPWQISMVGGTRPYTVTLSTLGATWVKNITVPPGLDVLTFINRAPPNKHLFAAVSDFTGRWATGTPMVKTKGKKDDSCPGLVSSESELTTIEKQDDAAKAATRSARRRRSTIIKILVPLALLVLFALAGAAFFYTRKRKREAEAELAETLPTPYIKTESDVLSSENNLELSANQPVSVKALLERMEARDSYLNYLNPVPAIRPTQPSSNIPLSWSEGPGGTASRSLANSTDAQLQRLGDRVSNPTVADLSNNPQWQLMILLAALIHFRQPQPQPRPAVTESSDDDGGSPSATTLVNEEAVFRVPNASDRTRRPRPYSS